MVRTLVVIYDPLLADGRRLTETMGWNDPHLLTIMLAGALRSASHGEAEHAVVGVLHRDEWPVHHDGQRHDESYITMQAAEREEMGPGDYRALLADNDILAKVQMLEVD